MPAVAVERIPNLKDGAGDWGQTTEDDDGNIVIKIDSKLKGLGLRRTLLHELLHATLEISGIGHLMSDEQEEALVRMHENIYLPLLADMELLINEIEGKE